MKSASARSNRNQRQAACFCVPVFLLAVAPAVAQDPPQMSHDGLVPVQATKVQAAYIDPNADFGVFRRVAILDPVVSFRSNWQRDQNRSRMQNVGTSDMERIKADVAKLFNEVFKERLEMNDGYKVVGEAGEDVLLLRPAIIDLDITAPDAPSGGRTRTYTSTTGAATLYIELFDSVSGDIIGRAIDRQVVRSPGSRLTWSTSVTNTQDARRMFVRWADQLRGFLDQYYTPND